MNQIIKATLYLLIGGLAFNENALVQKTGLEKILSRSPVKQEQIQEQIKIKIN